MWAGLQLKEIGDLTPEDITTAVQVEKEKQTDFYKMMAWLIYNGAALASVGFNNPKKFPTLEDAFPSIFEKKEQQDWRITKQRIETYANIKKLKSFK